MVPTEVSVQESGQEKISSILSLNPAEFLTDTLYFLHGYACCDDV
jgi:hypothetical protein